MDYKDFLKQVHKVVLKENRGAIKLTSKEKRAERRENRYKNARARERNINQQRRVRELREEMENAKSRQLNARDGLRTSAEDVGDQARSYSADEE